MQSYNKSHQILEATLVSADDTDSKGNPISADLRQFIGDIDYYESIFEPVLYMTFPVINSIGIFSKFKIHGGERVFLKIKHASGSLDTTQDLEMYVYKVSNIVQQNNKESFTLHLISREMFTNETTFLYRKYKGKISETVKSILSKELKTTRIGKIDPTSNVYDFMGNYKKPFQTLIWLSAKSISTVDNKKTSGSAGFLFYQNRDGYHFRAIDELFHQLKNTKNYFTYYQSHVSQFADADANFKLVSDPIFDQTVEMIEDLQLGKHASLNLFYDIVTRQPQFHKYTLEQSLPSLSGRTAGTLDKHKFPGAVGNVPSRVILKVIDAGTLSDKGDLKTAQDQPYYQSQSIMRYNLLFEQTLNITVPCNLQLKCGDVIKLMLPDTSNPKYSKNDLNASGFYLIKNLRHLFISGKERTALTLVRDSFGEQS